MEQDTTNHPNDAISTSAQYEDYWGVQETYTFTLKDGQQYFEIKPMDEGGKTRFQKLTNKGIRMNQRTNDATIDIDPSDERHTLIRESVVSFNIMQKDQATNEWSQMPCPSVDDARFKRQIDVILDKFNPKVIQELEFFIRSKNPWMQADMELSDLLEERDRLDGLIKSKREADAGELVSANK